MHRHLNAVALRRASALAACVCACACAVALGGCGSSATKTVSIVSGPTVTQSTPPTTTRAATTPTTTTTTKTPSPEPTSTAGGTAAPGAAHTAPEPQFTQQESHAEGVSEAVAVIKDRGYTANEPSQYHANQTLRVLIATKTGSSEGYDQQAFFFLDGRYIGTDTKEASASVKIVAQSDTEVTLAYPLYRKGDPLSSPSGGQAVVRFQLNNGKLTALDPIPPANSATAPSRY
jgi:hypothetical protein